MKTLTPERACRSLTFDENGNAVVSVTGDEDANAVYITVGDGVTPSDPTVAANDGAFGGRSGSVNTGVKITTGNEAIIKAVAADTNGTLGPVATAKQARRIGPFQKDTTTDGVSGTTSETVLKTITLPPGQLGENSSLRLTLHVQRSGVGGSKTLRIRFGGTIIASHATTTPGNSRYVTVLFNDGSASAQDSITDWVTGGGVAAMVKNTAAVDTSAAVDITVTGQLASAGGDAISVNLVLPEFIGTD